MSFIRTEVCARGDHASCGEMVVVVGDTIPLKPCQCRCHGGADVKRLYPTNPEARSSGWSGTEQSAA